MPMRFCGGLVHFHPEMNDVLGRSLSLRPTDVGRSVENRIGAQNEQRVGLPFFERLSECSDAHRWGGGGFAQFERLSNSPQRSVYRKSKRLNCDRLTTPGQNQSPALVRP